MLTIQPQEVPLQPAALRALEDLKKMTVLQERLQERINNAVQFITETSTQLNDRAYDERSQYSKTVNRRIAKGQSEDVDERKEHAELQEKVKSLTKSMDTNIRKMIDDKVWLEDIPSTLDHVKFKASNASSSARMTQTTTQLTEDDMNMDDASETSAAQSLTQPDPSNIPTNVLDAAFSTNRTKWASKSLTDRYSNHNDYVGWYRIVYDANHPGDNPPPMPHPSMWFAEEESTGDATVPHGSQGRRQQESTRNGRTNQSNMSDNSGSESDIEIAAERIRIKCPITLLPYKDPVASTKCPHAFEKGAILELFKHTSEHMPFTSEQLLELSQCRPQERGRRERQIRVPMVRCPECSVALSEKDLRPDPVLLRRVNRVLEKERRVAEAERRLESDIINAEDDEDEEIHHLRSTQRRNLVHLGSSPVGFIRRQSGRLKNERQ